MRFTLSLNDYIEQYLKNMKHDETHCPVCYEQVMCDSKSKDMEHMLDCYRAHLLETYMHKYKQDHGDIPDLTPELILRLVDQVQLEMELFCLKAGVPE